MSPALAVEGVAVRFGGVQAVDGVDFTVGAGEFVGLIGPNGAGKTTLVRIIAGMVRADRGRIHLGGADVTDASTAARVRGGLALTHQIVRPFRETSVLDNVVIAAGHRRTANPLLALLHTDRRRETERAAAIIARVGLAGTERKLAGTLPLGQLKRLELARALAVEPQLILLDEPLAGLNQGEASKQVETIVDVRREGVTIVLIEHNLKEVMRVCSRLIVLDNGKVIGDGEPRLVIADPAVHDAYVGSGAGSHADH
jgi:branched-chain amino acid transport system ATP-binding protein